MTFSYSDQDTSLTNYNNFFFINSVFTKPNLIFFDNTQTNARRNFCAHSWSCCMCSGQGAALIEHNSFCTQNLL